MWVPEAVWQVRLRTAISVCFTLLFKLTALDQLSAESAVISTDIRIPFQHTVGYDEYNISAENQPYDVQFFDRKPMLELHTIHSEWFLPIL